MTTETSASNATHRIYADTTRGLTRDISQEASDAGTYGHGHEEGTFCEFCAEAEPLPCFYCWGYEGEKTGGWMGPPTWIFPEEFWEKHVAHSTEASFCRKCGLTLQQLYIPWVPVAPGENYHADCLGYDENGEVKRP